MCAQIRGRRAADFIIIGAQKSATSTLHEIMASHDHVFIPHGELFFFDVDDIEQHPDFFVGNAEHTVWHDWDANLDTYLDWYAGHFSAAPEDALLGEDSTTYLASHLAPDRIAAHLPDVRLLAVIRDPVKRAYSHYWHQVRKGRAVASFEDTLKRDGGRALRRGCYADQLQRYAPQLRDGTLKVWLFEDLVRHPERVGQEALQHVGIDAQPGSFHVDAHRNASRKPLSISARLLMNRVTGGEHRARYAGKIPFTRGFNAEREAGRFEQDRKRAPMGAQLKSLLPAPPLPPMHPTTRAFLERYYRRENARLAELLDTDIAAWWPWM